MALILASKEQSGNIWPIRILLIYYIINKKIIKKGKEERIIASVRFFICSAAFFLLCYPCEALEGPISTRACII